MLLCERVLASQLFILVHLSLFLPLICHRLKSKCWGLLYSLRCFSSDNWQCGEVGTCEQTCKASKWAILLFSLICCPDHYQISLIPLTLLAVLTSSYFSFSLKYFTYNTYSQLSVAWKNVEKWYELLNCKRMKL